MLSSVEMGPGSQVRASSARHINPSQGLTSLPRLKTALLRSIAEKLIPGIPENTKIAILQQTRLTDGADDPKPAGGDSIGLSVLQTVIERATSRSIIEQEILSTSILEGAVS